MGKDLRGREIGKGLSQRKDKKYSARYVSISGKQIEKYFDTLPEARNWLADAKYEDSHGTVGLTSTATVDTWFEYWYNNIIVDLSPNTRRNYKERYKRNVQPIIGKMCILWIELAVYIHLSCDPTDDFFSFFLSDIYRSLANNVASSVSY